MYLLIPPGATPTHRIQTDKVLEETWYIIRMEWNNAFRINHGEDGIGMIW